MLKTQILYENQSVSKMVVVKVLCLLLCATGAFADAFERIAGGQPAGPGQFPFISSIRSLENIHICAGAIVNDRHILSAAHCYLVGNANPQFFIAYVAAYTRIDGIPHPLVRIAMHPRFNKLNLLNDIAILRTANSIVFNNLVRPAPLPTTDLPNGAQIQTFAAGWGVTGVIIGLEKRYELELIFY